MKRQIKKISLVLVMAAVIIISTSVVAPAATFSSDDFKETEEYFINEPIDPDTNNVEATIPVYGLIVPDSDFDSSQPIESSSEPKPSTDVPQTGDSSKEEQFVLLVLILLMLALLQLAAPKGGEDSENMDNENTRC